MARAHVKAVRRARSFFARRGPEHSHHVVAQTFHFEIEEHLPRERLVRALLRANDDPLPVGHDAQLGERARHFRQRFLQCGDGARHVAKTNASREESLRGS